MVVETKRFVASEKRWVSNYYGLSTDERPTGYINGSRYHEIDTGKVFMYDETNDIWYLQPSGTEEGLVVYAENNALVNGYQVPEITSEQLTSLYNAVMGGKDAVIVDETGTMCFVVNSVKVDDDSFYLNILYFDIMILTYALADDQVTITYKKIGDTSGLVVEIGSGQYEYETYVLPTIPVDLAREIYARDKAGVPQVLHWTLYGSENNLKVVSSDLIAGTYSIDILVHNKFHCAYSWVDATTGNINPSVISSDIPTAVEISDDPSDLTFVTEGAIYRYLASGNNGKPRALDNVDLDTILNTGFYSCNVCTHRPTENNGVMLVIKNAALADNAIQVYWTFVADVMWVRHRDNGVWKAWTKVLVPADIEGKQNSTDNTLATLAKTIVGAINEVNSIAKGASKAISFDSYSDMVDALNDYDEEELLIGQNIYVITQDVPDLWISEIDSTSVPYTYVDDDTLVQALIDDGYVQIGYYAVSMLETQKVDLTNYVQKEEGKGLSEEDFTSEEKAKLEDIEEGAEKNDPNTVIDDNYVHTDNNFDNTAKNKLAGIEDGAEVSHDLVTRRYEGVDLAVKFADEITAQGSIGAWLKWRCQQNKLDDLFPHDYFTITFKNGSILKAEIAGIDQYLHNGDTEITKHHIDFITKDCWSPTVQYNKVNYNNGIGLDKFTGDGAETTFQLTHRANGNFPALSKVTVGGTDVSNYSYDVTTGQLTFDEAPTGVIKAVWETPVEVPYLASNIYAYINSLKMGVPNEAAADPTLTEVDYTQDGIWYNMPDDLKAVIIEKRFFTGTRFTIGTLRTSDNNNKWVNLGKIWIPDEMEVYGHPVWGSYQWTYAFGRQYPCFRNGNRTKGVGNGGSRTYWWLLPASSGNSAFCAGVGSGGHANYNSASSSGIRAAFGFRISA